MYVMGFDGNALKKQPAWKAWPHVYEEFVEKYLQQTGF
jgi:hypothetical protein